MAKKPMPPPPKSPPRTARDSPQLKEASLNVGWTCNIGNYESVRMEMGLTAVVGPDDDVAEITAQMRDRMVVAMRVQLPRVVEDFRLAKGNVRGLPAPTGR